MRRYGPRTLLLELAMLAAAAAFAYPVYALVVTSFKDPRDAARAAPSLPDTWQGVNYSRAWTEGSLAAALLNSTLITVVGLIAIVALGSLAGYYLARTHRRVGYRVYLLFLAGLFLPMQLALVPLYRLASDTGMLGSYTGILIVYCGMQMPLTVFLYTGFIRAMPREHDEAALVDGASHLQTFARVTFPMLRPVTAVVVVINAVFIWNDFLTPLLYLGGTEKETVPVAVYRFVGQYQTDWGPILAAVVIATAPMLIAFLVLARRSIETVERSFAPRGRR